ncbi:hypothetical protein KCP78_20810 [Salmonella enterica subsp. enterica]|nr:hypothetical protein KCP78_20810 [Salmonella enterica subsp. enterica]
MIRFRRRDARGHWRQRDEIKWLQRYIDELKGKSRSDRRADSRRHPGFTPVQHGNTDARRALDKDIRTASQVRLDIILRLPATHVSTQEPIKVGNTLIINGQRRY